MGNSNRTNGDTVERMPSDPAMGVLQTRKPGDDHAKEAQTRRLGLELSDVEENPSQSKKKERIGIKHRGREGKEFDRFVSAGAMGDVQYLERNLHLLNAKDLSGDTALHAACVNNRADVIELFVRQGGALEVDCEDNNKATPLMIACGNGNEGIARMLIDVGANVRARDTNGWTPMLYAAAGGHVNIAKLLVLSRANVDDIAWTGRTNALYLAAHENALEMVRFLLLQGLDPREEDANQDTPEQVAEEEHVLQALQRARSVWEAVEYQVRNSTLTSNDEADLLLQKTESGQADDSIAKPGSKLKEQIRAQVLMQLKL